MADTAVIKAFKKAIRATGASPRVAKALFEAGITESGLRNLNYGDRDSLGALQQRPSSGYKHATQPYQAALDFIRQAQQTNRGFHGSAGQLAQAVQRSAFPGRYDQHSGEANQLLAGTPTGRGGSPYNGATTTTTRSTQVDEGARKALLAQYLLDRGNPDALLSLAVGIENLPTNTTVTKSTKPNRPKGRASNGTAAKGVATFEGKKVAAWIAPILRYARQHGWKGTINSGYRSYADQQRIYNSGVRPAAKPGTSNHEFTAFPGGAVDVSDAPTLARILSNSPYRGKLVYAGAKDPVHFSHPHNGGY
jgi:hypothetical protein